MSASREKQRRKDVGVPAGAEVQKKGNQTLHRVLWICGIVLAIVVLVLAYMLSTNWFAAHVTALTVGEHNITAAEYNYHYSEVRYQYTQMFGGEVDDDTLQMLATSMTNQTDTRIQQIYAVYDKAIAEGYTLDADHLAEIDQEIADLETTAASYGYASGKALLTAMYGSGSTQKSYRDYRTVTEITSHYTQDWLASFTQEDVDAYYAEHQDELGTEADHRTVNVRHILISDHEKAEEVYQEYLDGEKTEDAFAALAETYSEDNADEGGLYENVTKGQMVEAFDAWIFDESRQPGDTDIVETEYGHHIMYFVSEGENDFADDIRDSFENEKYQELVDELTADYPVEENAFGMRFTAAIKPAPQEETAEETAETTEETAEAPAEVSEEPAAEPAETTEAPAEATEVTPEPVSVG